MAAKYVISATSIFVVRNASKCTVILHVYTRSIYYTVEPTVPYRQLSKCLVVAITVAVKLIVTSFHILYKLSLNQKCVYYAYLSPNFHEELIHLTEIFTWTSWSHCHKRQNKRLKSNRITSTTNKPTAVMLNARGGLVFFSLKNWTLKIWVSF